MSLPSLLCDLSPLPSLTPSSLRAPEFSAWAQPAFLHSDMYLEAARLSSLPDPTTCQALWYLFDHEECSSPFLQNVNFMEAGALPVPASGTASCHGEHLTHIC